MKEQIGPSSRFQYSLDEMRAYFVFDVESEYKIPIAITLNGLLKGLISSPMDLILYMIVFAYTRIKKQQRKVTTNTLWEVEESTKAP